MSELVLLHHNEPMTTSETIAEGVELAHKTVIQLVRKYAEDLQEFGTLAFEMRKSGGRHTEFAYLNEPQATLLITYLRNSDIVRRFKIALVKAFYELRDRVGPAASILNPAHAADHAVAAARSFNAMMRAGRSLGLPLPRAAERANDFALRRSGVDVMAEMGVSIGDLEASRAATQADPEPDPIREGVTAWAENAGPGPWSMAEIAAQAFGLQPGSRKYFSAIVKIGPVLAGIGIRRRKTRVGKVQQWLWER